MLIIQYSSNTWISIASCKHKDKVKQNLRNSSPVRDKDTARLNLFIFSVSTKYHAPFTRMSVDNLFISYKNHFEIFHFC